MEEWEVMEVLEVMEGWGVMVWEGWECMEEGCTGWEEWGECSKTQH